MATQQINTIIILRNDSTTAWESSDYVMETGELGVGYTADGKVIVKAGNGVKTWKDLPQVEGVFENDLTLTYAFGKYSPDDTGSFTLETAGKTMSEVMLDAFAQEEFEGLIVTKPSATFAVSGGKTNEVGNTYSADVVATLTLTPTGSYKYGAVDADGNKEQTDISFTSANIRQDSSTAIPIKTIADASNNKVTYTIDVSDTVLADGTVTYTFYGDAAYGADANRPLTNLGNMFKKDENGDYVTTKTFSEAIGNIPAATALSSTKKTVSYTGYRKMFMGSTNLATPTIDSAFIRKLSQVSVQAAKATKEVSAAANDTALYFAYPTSLTSAAPTFEYFIANEWKPLSGAVLVGNDIPVEGANNYQSVNYTVYKYSPNSGIFDGAMKTRITIK